MKLIKAYVREFMAHKVIDALRDLKAPRITVVDVKALGDEIDHAQLGLSAKVGTYTKMAKLEIICNDECAERVQKTILATARTGHKGDGIIAVSHIEEAVSIRTGERAIEG